jgi:Holliday junction resolvase RusA-like endonuclease
LLNPPAYARNGGICGVLNELGGGIVEIEFPVEFLVEGTPMSLQAKQRKSIERWKRRIVEASRGVLPEVHFATTDPLAITIFYFPAKRMEGDLDNIVKPILDALEKHIYVNDRQIHRALVQIFEAEDPSNFDAHGPLLEEALNKPKPVLYIHLSDDPYKDFK